MSRSSSRRLLVTAAAATSVALLASACGKSAAQPSTAPVAAAATHTSAAAPTSAAPSTSSTSPASPASPAKPAPQYAAGTPLISDGTATVTIAGTPVTFPTTVSEASWSPDGSRIAFVDGSGNVATARPDGSSMVVLVKPDQGSKLSGPSWQGGTVLYTEQNAAGTHFVRQAQAVGQSDHSSSEMSTPASTEKGTWTTVADASNPTSTEARNLFGTSSTLVFQAHSAKGQELWIHHEDSNARGGANSADQFAEGSWPALSADGALAFVGKGGGIEMATAAAMAKAYGTTPPATTLEADAANATHLTWTPDGKQIAYSTPTGIMELAAGQPGAAPTQLSAKPGVVSFLPTATDHIVTLSGTSPTDLVGASVSVSQHRWLTQTGTTPEPAGAGPHGPYAMSVTIIAADDPQTAQKELGWAGLYGPTLLSTGHGTLDPRLTTEIKRVLGTPNTQNPFDGLDTVTLVGAPGAFPANADAAITKLGYKVAHVSTAPKPDAATPTLAPAPIAVVDPADTAALTEAKADGARVMQLSAGKLAASDLTYLKGLDSTWDTTAPQIIAFGDRAFTAATAVPLKRFATPTEALGTTHSDFLAALAMNAMTTNVTIVPSNSPADILLAELSSPQKGYLLYSTSVATVDPTQGISPTLKALLDTRSANIDELDVIDTAAKLPANLATQLGALISGPLGTRALANQTADDVAKAEGASGHEE
ncbi:hypothetical protein ABIA35_002708 [Catenulispora sp. MAP12-49]|uniref:hypothetical protein n=1 Tax=Catenulispora sp. MAP12-49 TaxID=3156302 RepID=UPI0035182DD4